MYPTVHAQYTANVDVALCSCVNMGICGGNSGGSGVIADGFHCY